MTYAELYEVLKPFPHIQRRLDLVWGTEFCRPYLQELLMPARLGRRGFPFEVLVAIQDLMDLHDETFVKYCPKDRRWNRDVE